MPIIAALVGIVLGAVAAIAYMRTAKQGSLHEADEKIQSAHAQAESLIGDAKRQAETLKKEEERNSYARESRDAARGVARSPQRRPRQARAPAFQPGWPG